MAKIEFEGIDEYAKQLDALGAAAEKACKYAAYNAAGMVIDAIKSNCPADTGDLRESMILTEFRNDDGFVYTKVDFAGYDEKGVPNRLKARVLESGRSDRPGYKHPFIRPAVNRVKGAAQIEIERSLDYFIKNIMKG